MDTERTFGEHDDDSRNGYEREQEGDWQKASQRASGYRSGESDTSKEESTVTESTGTRKRVIQNLKSVIVLRRVFMARMGELTRLLSYRLEQAQAKRNPVDEDILKNCLDIMTQAFPLVKNTKIFALMGEAIRLLEAGEDYREVETFLYRLAYDWWEERVGSDVF